MGFKAPSGVFECARPKPRWKISSFPVAYPTAVRHYERGHLENNVRLTEHEFGSIMKRVLSPSHAIETPDLLKGRDKQLGDIRRALHMDGRQIFIYGYRGVGKTSLAQTAAIQHQSSDADPIKLGCSENGTFFQTIQDLFGKAFPSDPSTIKTVLSGSAGVKWKALSAEVKTSIEKGRIPNLTSLNEAVALTEFVSACYAKQPVVLLDEFDLIKSPQEQGLFAGFVKQIADQRINIRFFFCGIADSIDQFFGSHESTYRYFFTVKLDRLDISPRLEIIDLAARALSIHVDDNTTRRIARISDGFPHFIHLVCEKLFWTVYNDPRSDMRATPDHYETAVSEAVEDIQPYLRGPYEKATRKYTNDSEPILWAVADTHELQRQAREIYKSYERIMGHGNVKALTRERFNTRINALKTPAFGSIVTATRAGWYEYREKMMRGYARLRAEQKGIELESEHPMQERRFGAARDN